MLEIRKFFGKSFQIQNTEFTELNIELSFSNSSFEFFDHSESDVGDEEGDEEDDSVGQVVLPVVPVRLVVYAGVLQVLLTCSTNQYNCQLMSHRIFCENSGREIFEVLQNFAKFGQKLAKLQKVPFLFRKQI